MPGCHRPHSEIAKDFIHICVEIIILFFMLTLLKTLASTNGVKDRVVYYHCWLVDLCDTYKQNFFFFNSYVQTIFNKQLTFKIYWYELWHFSEYILVGGFLPFLRIIIREDLEIKSKINQNFCCMYLGKEFFKRI